MLNYYFVGTLLPDLYIDEKPEVSFEALKTLFYDNLSPKDFAMTTSIRNYYDIYNLRAYWKGEEFDPIGNLDANELEEALITRSLLPQYVFDYLDKYETEEARLKHFPALLATFYKVEIMHTNGAFRRYLILERELRLLMVAYRARKLGRDVVKELQYEYPEDEFVAQIIAQKDSDEFQMPEKYADFKPILDHYYHEPIAFQKAFYEYIFSQIDQMVDIDSFSVDRLLAYMVKLIMVEKWQHLDKEKGLKIIDSILKEPT